MPTRYYAFLRKVMYLVFLFIILTTAAIAQVIINPTGGTNASNGLRIEVNNDGTFKIFRNGRSESSDAGINAFFRTKSTYGNYYNVNNPISITYCDVSPVVVKPGPTVDTFKVFMSGRSTYYSYTYLFELNVTTIITYVKGDKYFTLDYIFFNNDDGINPRLYLTESLNMQDPIGASMSGNQEAGIGIATPVGAVNQVGFSRNNGLNATPGSFSHTFHALNTFASYSARYEYEMEDVNNSTFNLYNTVAGASDPNNPRGIGVEVTMDYKMDAKRAVGTRVGVGYTDNTSPVHITLPTQTATNSTQIKIGFESATASGDEGNNNALSNAKIKLKVLQAGLLNVPLYVKMKLKPDPLEAHPAVVGTDFNFTGVLVIPPDNYTVGKTIDIDNIKIIGNNTLEYSRKFTVELDSICSNYSQLVSIDKTGFTSCVYTIIDDEPRDITLSGRDLLEGLTDEVVRVTLPPGVAASEPTGVTLSVTGGTATLNTDYTFQANSTILKDSNGVYIPVKALLDKILEDKESIIFKADATVMGEAKSSNLTIYIQDSTRRDTSLTKIRLIKPDPSLLKEPFDGKLTVTLPTDVTTDLPINITIAKDPTSTATETADYTLPGTATITASNGSVDVPFKIFDDGLIEGKEYLYLSLTATDGVAGTVYKGWKDTITIIDAQTPTPPIQLHISASSVDEGGTDPQIWASLPAGINTAIPITIDFAVDATSTVDASSYTYTSSVTIDPTKTVSNKVNIHVQPNLVFDDGGDLVLVGSCANPDITVNGSLKLTIVDKTDASKKVITLTADSTQINEGNKTGITASLPTGYSSAKDLQIALVEHSTSEAKLTKDFTLLTPITLTHRQNSQKTNNVLVALTDDVIEKDEIAVIDGSLTGYDFQKTQVKIMDLTRRTAANTKLTFTYPLVPMPENSNQTIGYALPTGITTEIPISIDLSGTKGTAINGTDYTLPTPATLSTGNSSSVTLVVKSDILVEGDETIYVGPTITDAYSTAYTSSIDTLRMTIKDAQYPFTGTDSVILSASPNPVSEGATATITATFPNGWKAGKNWDIAITKDAAASVATGRHTALPTNITIVDGSASGSTAPITITPNYTFDDDGILKIDDNMHNTDMPVTSAILQIKDATDASKKVLTLVADSTTLFEGNKTGIKVSLPSGYTSTKDIVINLTRNTSSEAGDGDITMLSTITLDHDKNSDVIADVIEANADNIIEKDEQLKISATATGYGFDAYPQLQILDKTRRTAANTKFTFTYPLGLMPENSNQTIGYALPTGITTEIPISIDLSGTKGTAINGTDYTLPTPATLSTGNSSSVTLVVKSDILVEGDETIYVGPTITDAYSTAYTSSIDTLRMTIKDAQYPFTGTDSVILSASPNPVSEGATATITATFPNGWKAGKNWDIAITKDAAASVATGRHTALPTNITIVDGSASGSTAPITITPNYTFDDDGILKIDDNMHNTDMPVTSAILQIKDATDASKKVLTLVADSTTLFEGNKTGIKVSLPSGYTSTKDIVINLTRNTSSEAGDGDITMLSTITLDHDKNSDVIADVIEANADNIIEKDEQLKISATATGYGFDAYPQLQILDKTRRTAANTKLTFTYPLVPMPENSNQTIGYALPTGITTEIPITINLSGTKGTAINGTDYTLPTPATLSTGNSSSVTLVVKPDILVEGDETIYVGPVITDAYSTAYTSSIDTLRMTIKDAQYPFPAGDYIILTSNPDSIYEGGASKITATLPNGWKAGRDWAITLAKDAVASTVADARHSAIPATITISDGQASGTSSNISTYTNNILDDEGKIVVTANAGNTNMPAKGTEIYIKDQTEKLPNARVLAATPATPTIAEGNKYNVTVKAPYVSTKPVTVQFSIATGSTATLNTDYTISNTSVTLQPGETTKTFELLDILPDDVLEADEKINVHATVNGYTINDLVVTITDVTRTIAANRVITVNVPSPLTEGDDKTVTFSLPTGITTEVPITVQLPQTSGTAEAGLDYVLASQVVINSGNSTTTSLKINTDNFIEGPETIVITPTATDGISSYVVNIPTITIEDDPLQYPIPAPIVLNSSVASIDEGAATGATLSAQLPNNLQAGRDITVRVVKDAARSTAVDADHNVIPSPYDIVIKKGQNVGQHAFELKALLDLILEDDETVVFTGSVVEPLFAAATVKDTTIIIKDHTHDDPSTGFVHLTAVTTGTHVLEGNSYTMKVSLAPGVTSSKDVKVGLAIGAGSIATAADIDQLPDTVVIAAGQPSATFTFIAKNDFIIEKPKLLWITATPNLSGMQGDKLSVIIDDATGLNPDNRKMEWRIDSSLIHEGSASAVTYGFVNSQITSDEDIVVNISLNNTTSTADAADYTGVPAQMTLLAGEHNKTISLQIVDDNILEGDEQLQFNVQLVTAGYTITQPGMVLIPETGNMSVQLLKGADAAEPATNGSYIIKLPGNSTAAADVKVVFYVSSIAGTTNIAPIQTSATILVGDNSVSVPVNVIDNKVIDGDETVSVALMLAQMKRFNRNIPLDVNDKDTVKLTVFDDESKSPGREMMIEKISDASEPSINGIFRVHFADAAITAAKNVEITYAVGGTATPIVRYHPLSGKVTIPAGQNGADITVAPIDNDIVEGDETVIVDLKSVASTMVGVTWPISSSSSATMNIHDNDTLVVDLTTTVTTIEEGKDIVFKLTSPSRPAHDMPIRVQVLQDAVRTFTTSEGIVNSNIITVMMPANSKEHSFTIAAKDNDINDDNGFLKATILPYLSGTGSLIYKPGTNYEAQVAITDNDPLTLSFAAEKFSVKEGNTGDITPLKFNVQMNRQSSRPITISYDFEEATDGVSFPFMDFKATPGVDFDNTVKQATIAPLQMNGQIAVNIIGDDIFEQNETFIVKMLNATVPSGQNVPTIGTPNSATGVILNDDPMCKTCDTDGDGLTDEEEDINQNGDPFDDDTDGDGIPNFLDLDSDGDGVPDSVERFSTDKRVINNNSGKLRVHPAISPNNDGLGNDLMWVENIDKYPDNEVTIFNRWGGTVFKLKNYDNKSRNFRGKANTGSMSGNDVPEGSYFYNINVVIDGKREQYTGFIVIKR
ncbi:Calx-beta domain-containing protein [Chitinophaga silvatica]|nr:Calx-beta domain-containing protein [Chitinophaga silvatica]